jgi:hypothetical protein
MTIAGSSSTDSSSRSGGDHEYGTRLPSDEYPVLAHVLPQHRSLSLPSLHSGQSSPWWKRLLPGCGSTRPIHQNSGMYTIISMSGALPEERNAQSHQHVGRSSNCIIAVASSSAAPACLRSAQRLCAQHLCSPMMCCDHFGSAHDVLRSVRARVTRTDSHSRSGWYICVNNSQLHIGSQHVVRALGRLLTCASECRPALAATKNLDVDYTQLSRRQHADVCCVCAGTSRGHSRLHHLCSPQLAQKE